MGRLRALLALPFQRYRLAMIFLFALMAVGWCLPLLIQKKNVLWASLGMHAYALMFLSMLSGMVVSSICRPDTQLLPDFRRQMALAWALCLTLFVGGPGVVIFLFGTHALLITGALALVTALGLATGSGAKWASLVWMLPLLLGLWPEMRSGIWYALIDSNTAPLAVLLLSAAILWASWRRFMAVNDQAPTLSPADINTSDLRYGPEAVQAANAGKFTRWFLNRQQAASARAFEGVLAKLGRRRQSAAQRALSLILMPNLHWRGVLLEVLWTVLFVIVIGLVIAGQSRGSTLSPAMVATYVGMLAALRFQALHRATMMLRPSLTDAYFALAPSSQLEFSGQVARALRPAVLSALIFAATLLGVLGFFVPPEARIALIAGGLFGAAAASLYGLGVVLMLLDAQKPHMLSGVLVLSVGGSTLASIATAAFTTSIGAGIATGVLLILFMLGFVAHGESYARRWPIRFDMPA